MKLVVLTPWWPTRERPWFGNFVQNQAVALAQQGASVDVVLALPFYARTADLARNGVSVGRVVRIPLLPMYTAAGLTWPLAGRHLRRILGSGFDCVVIHTEVLAAMIGPELRKPYFVVVHGTNTDCRPLASPARRRLLYEGLRAAKGVISVGRSLNPWIRDTYSFSGPVETIENGYDPEAEPLAGKPILMEETVTISCVGGLEEDKGQGVLIDAARTLAESGRRLIIHLVGDGTNRRELERRAALARRLEIVFHGWQAPAEASRIIAQSDIFVLPSRREALGIVYLNAMALGRPVVGVRGQGIDGIVTNEVNGFLVPADDATALANRLLWMIEHPSETRVLAQRGREFVRAEATWARNAERFMSLMRGEPAT